MQLQTAPGVQGRSLFMPAPVLATPNAGIFCDRFRHRTPPAVGIGLIDLASNPANFVRKTAKFNKLLFAGADSGLRPLASSA